MSGWCRLIGCLDLKCMFLLVGGFGGVFLYAVENVHFYHHLGLDLKIVEGEELNKQIS